VQRPILIANGNRKLTTRTVTILELFERIAHGLGIPDDARMLLGLAPCHPAGLDHLSASELGIEDSDLTTQAYTDAVATRRGAAQ